MKSLKGFLIDLDGVLYIENEPISGAADALQLLRRHGYPLRFLTNTTGRSRSSLAKKLTGFGIEAQPTEIFSTCVVAAHWFKKQGVRRIHPLVPEDALADFTDFDIVDETPEAVVVGDLAQDFNFKRLNRAFRMIMGGATLVGLQKNRYWQTQDGLSLDTGAFVALLEYATETEAVLIGKPSRNYFEMAIKDMDLPASEIVMLGDDLETDIIGGKNAGLQTVFVKTGKSSAHQLESLEVKPDWVLNSIADLPDWLNRL